MKFFYSNILIFLFLFSVSNAQDFWTQCAVLDTGLVRAVVIDSNDNIYAGMMRERIIYKSTDEGAGWKQMVYLDDASIWSMSVCPNNFIFAAANGGAGVYRSIDEGETWESLDLGLPFNSVNDVTANQNKEIIAATDAGIYVSRDEGKSWFLSSDGIPVTLFYTIEYDYSNNIIYAGTASEGMYKSVDNGNSWIEINDGITYSYMYGLGVNDNGDVYAGADGNAFYKSTNQGNTWIDLINNFPSHTGPIPTIAFNSLGHVYVGMEWGAPCYRSTDNGVTWVEKTSGFPSIGVWSIAINSQGIAFAGTHLNGMFKSTESTTSFNPDDNQFQNSFHLRQNYPNPFNASTTIIYSIPKTDFVQIKVYDIQGKIIANLVDRVQHSGQHRIEFSTTSLPSGVYFYRLDVGSFNATKKLLSLK